MRFKPEGDVRDLVRSRLGRGADAETGSDASGDGGESSSRSLQVLQGAAVAAVLAAIVLTFLSWKSTDEQKIGDEAVEVVSPRLEQLLSYTPATVESEVASEVEWLTGEFADSYEELVIGTIAPAAVAGGVETSATVQAVGIDAADDERVVLLVFVNVSTVSAEAPEPQLTGSRLRVTVRDVDGDWKISEIRPI